MDKYAQFGQLMEERIRRGDYALRELPTEQELARELGASRKTARRAIQRLLEKGIVARKPYGRLTVNRKQGRLQLAFLGTSYYSQTAEAWRFAVNRAAERIGATVRPVDFVHWDDPIIAETIEAFDGVFIMPSSENIPPAVLERFHRTPHLVSLENDLSEWNVPSVHLLPPRFIHVLGDHLYKLGHRRIDCLNTQPQDSVIQRRSEQWMLWRRLHRVEGHLINEPVQPYQHAAPQAYEVMKRLLSAGEFKATGLVCLTNAAALGSIRALQEHGIRVGKDVSVCAMEGGQQAQLMWPSWTVLNTPEPDVYINVCVDWIAKRKEPWIGPHLMEPATMTLFEGESTGPAPATRPTKKRLA
jgi:DNA-binding LacI/PurR family transcriptional regulator